MPAVFPTITFGWIAITDFCPHLSVSVNGGIFRGLSLSNMNCKIDAKQGESQ